MLLTAVHRSLQLNSDLNDLWKTREEIYPYKHYYHSHLHKSPLSFFFLSFLKRAPGYIYEAAATVFLYFCFSTVVVVVETMFFIFLFLFLDLSSGGFYYFSLIAI